MAHSRPSAGVSWVRFVVYGILDMKEFSNDFWYSVTAGAVPEPASMQVVARDWYHNFITPAWTPALTTSVILRGCYAEFNDGAGTLGTDVYEEVNGSGISTYMPEDVAVVVQKISDFRHPTGRGRWYFCGLGQGDVNGSYLNASGLTDWRAFATQLKTAYVNSDVGLTLSPAVFSPHTQQLHPIVDTPVVALLGTRRRRRGPF